MIDRPELEAEARYRRLHESMTDAFVSVSMDGLITESNRSFQELTGYTPGELSRLTYVDLTPARWHEMEARIVSEQIIPHGHSGVYEKEYRRKDGTIVPIELRTFLIRDAGGEPDAMWAIVRDISKRKRLQEELKRANEILERHVEERTSELRESLARFQTLSDSLTDCCLLTDSDGRIIDVNPATVEQIGYSRDELLSMHRGDIGMELPPEKLDALDRRLFETGEKASFLSRQRRKDGSSFPSEVLLIPIPLDGRFSLLISIRDISERVRAEEAVRESEARFRNLAMATHEGIVVLAGEQIVDANAQLAEMLGCELTDLIGRCVMDFTAPAFRESSAARIRSGLEEQYRLDVMREDGTVFPGEIRSRMMIINGRQLRVSALRDLTENKRLEAILARQRRELIHSQSLATLAEVGAGITHQIAQPLCAATNNLAALRNALTGSTDGPGRAATFIDDIEADLKRIASIIRGLKSLTHPERLHRKPLDLNELVSQVIQLLSPCTDSQQLNLVIELQQDLPELPAEPVQMSQVIFNLLQNAIEAVETCAEQPGTIHITTRRIEPGFVEFCIRDNGPGIDPQALPRIFEFLFTTKHEGDGVGLALCQRIVAAHGGSIEAANNEDRPGATFRVILPTSESPP